MIDIAAAFRLLTAASQLPAPPNLLDDALYIYKTYDHSRTTGGFRTKDYDMKRLIDSAAGVAVAAQALAKDPTHLADIVNLINSL